MSILERYPSLHRGVRLKEWCPRELYAWINRKMCLSFWRSVQLLRERAVSGGGGGGSGEESLVKILDRHPAMMECKR